MTAIFTSDIHLTDRAQDEYRWDFFDWLAQLGGVDEYILGGDITDSKDKHSAKLVNRFIDKLNRLLDHGNVYFLKGNHDYFNPESPFFEFIDSIPRAVFIKDNYKLDLSIGKCLFIPAGQDWNLFPKDFYKGMDFIFTHVTFSGSEAENGALLPGVDPSILDNFDGICLSGDIHVPQKVREHIRYVGAPYHIRFGDTFEPRVLKISNNGALADLAYKSPRKYVVTILDTEELYGEATAIKPGSFVKVKCLLKRTDYVKWKEIQTEIKKLAKEREWQLFGPELLPLEVSHHHREKSDEEKIFMSSTDLVEDYAKKHQVSDRHLSVGRSLLL